MLLCIALETSDIAENIWCIIITTNNVFLFSSLLRFIYNNNYFYIKHVIYLFIVVSLIYSFSCACFHGYIFKDIILLLRIDGYWSIISFKIFIPELYLMWYIEKCSIILMSNMWVCTHNQQLIVINHITSSQMKENRDFFQ